MDIKSFTPEKIDQLKRGKRIKYIREAELHMSKAKLGRSIGISGQFLGLVEDGKSNLTYKSIKKLKDLSGHSTDYILFGLDDEHIKRTKELLNNYSDDEIIHALNLIEKITFFIKKR
ncbi:MAG: helix-turn-helix transcriptional regulator [Clostridia bacterium]|nr:helix-turn-helix transcriptional regulator [Clostridia bacterium]